MTVPPLDLGSCPGCGFTVGGISAGCVNCALRHPARYAAWVVELQQELDDLRAELRQIRQASIAGRQES